MNKEKCTKPPGLVSETLVKLPTEVTAVSNLRPTFSIEAKHKQANIFLQVTTTALIIDGPYDQTVEACHKSVGICYEAVAGEFRFQRQLKYLNVYYMYLSPVSL